MKKSIINHSEFLKLYDENLSDVDISKTLKLDRNIIRKYRINLNLPPNKKIRKMTEETKKIMSEKRKKWLNENPDKHPWRNKDKFQSKPCENVKQYLNSLNISFVSEYNPNIPDRFFSIDIALPDKMIAIEINGNQHYEKDGSLKPYYQERHNILENNGWRVFEIHYSHCFDLNKWANFVKEIRDSSDILDFDYSSYIPNKQNKKYYCECGKGICYGVKNCAKCHTLKSRKIKNRPTKEELISLVDRKPMTEIAKMYGVSDNTIRKWIKFYSKSS